MGSFPRPLAWAVELGPVGAGIATRRTVNVCDRYGIVGWVGYLVSTGCFAPGANGWHPSGMEIERRTRTFGASDVTANPEGSQPLARG
jgi:hypothetical protein